MPTHHQQQQGAKKVDLISSSLTASSAVAQQATSSGMFLRNSVLDNNNTSSSSTNKKSSSAGGGANDIDRLHMLQAKAVAASKGKDLPQQRRRERSNSTDTADSDDDDGIIGMGNYESQLSLFEKAALYIRPGRFFRWIVYLYAERKMMVVFWMHFVATMIIWVHFGLIKFDQKKNGVPAGAPFYWWKRIAPPLEFGSMHAILFQMALLPLTMSRYTIAAAGSGLLNRFLPLNRAVDMHIHLGYTMCGIVFIATIFFFIFFGINCAAGDQSFCDKFTSEIMCTGYGIFGLLCILGTTSYFRHHPRMPYEVFYVVHHLVFVMYLLVVMHTLDHLARTGAQQRSQTFAWFSATLLYYVCDRAAMHINQKFKARLVSVSTMQDTSLDTQSSSRRNRRDLRRQSSSSTTTTTTHKTGSRMMVIKLQRPVLFRFQPGQYAFIKLPKIDPHHWHPFSIASGPSSQFLEFFIEVMDDEKSWTCQLWNALYKTQDNTSGGAPQRVDYSSDDDDMTAMMGRVAGAGAGGGHNFYPEMMDFEIMGPYGTALASDTAADYSHCLAVGAGTGIVPVLSLFQSHVRRLMRYQPAALQEQLRQYQASLRAVELATEVRKGSVIQRILQTFCWANYGGPAYVDLQGNDHYQRGTQTKSDAIKATIQASVSRRLQLDPNVHHVTSSITGGTGRTTGGSYGNGSGNFDDDDSHHTRSNNEKITKRELRDNQKQMRNAAFQATRSIYGTVFLAIMPVMGVTIFGLTISWNTIDIHPLYKGMCEFLMAFTILFQACFALLALFVWDASQAGFLAYMDVAICIVAPAADTIWFDHYERTGALPPVEITTFCLLIGYMTARLWNQVVKPRHASWRALAAAQEQAPGGSGGNHLECMEMIWVTRSALLASNIFPQMNDLWDQLVDAWDGNAERAAQFCKISVYVTDRDQRAVTLLKQELKDTSLYKAGCLHTGRPDFTSLLQQHTVRLTCTRRNSYTLLAFCGSPQLAKQLHSVKINNDIVTAITGNKKHAMHIVSECYGGLKHRNDKSNENKNSFGYQRGAVHDDEDDDDEEEMAEHEEQRTRLTTRQVTSFGLKQSLV